jgi:hypothetical protein
MSTPPWVNFWSNPTPAIDSTPTLIFLSANTCIIKAIGVCNTSNVDIFVTVTALQERTINDTPTPITTHRFRNVPLKLYQTFDLIEGNQQILQAGDSLFANSDFSGNTFDCWVDYEELLEE